MIKVMFGKTIKTDVVLRYKQLNEYIYVYKLKYTVKGNKVNTYGLCFKEDLSMLKERLLIPKRLSQYKVYHKEFLDELREHGTLLDCVHEINLKDFFNRDESLVPIPEDCVILKSLTPNVPNTYFPMMFFYEYTEEHPVPRVVPIGHLNGKGHLDPLVCDNKYDLEECLRILRKRKDIDFGLYNKIIPINATFLFEEELEEIVKEYSGVEESMYLDFSWRPNKEDWKKYYDQLENYGLDVANKYLVDNILKLKKKEC